MIGFDQAAALVRSAARPLGSEKVAIADASGRVLAAPVVATLDSPRADVSVMDGYAVRAADLPGRLRVVGESFAGAAWSGAVEPGTCVRIFTGAPVPRGADRVVMQEDIERDSEFAVAREPGAARHIRSRGADFTAGDELLAAGRLLDPRAMVAAAAADVGSVEVYRQPRLHILSTGDEIAAPGSARRHPDAVPDSVSLGVAALARQWGALCSGRTRLRDELRVMERVASECIGTVDVAVVTGGASVGERDFARAMFEPAGLELIFSKVAIRPGKPVWLGRAGKALVMGVPGNPTSAMVTARLLLAPLLAGLGGQGAGQALEWRSASLASALPPCGERETFHRGRSIGAGVELLPFQDSGAQKALAEADLLVRQRANSAAVAAGDAVEVLDF